MVSYVKYIIAINIDIVRYRAHPAAVEARISDGSIWTANDDVGHNQPTIVIDSDGFIHAWADMHNNEWRYFRSSLHHSAISPSVLPKPIQTVALRSSAQISLQGDGERRIIYFFRPKDHQVYTPVRLHSTTFRLSVRDQAGYAMCRLFN